LNKIKVIQILTHSPSWVTRNIEEDIYDGWQVRTAKAIKKISDEFDFFCILPEKNISQTITEKKDDITYQVFPSTAIAYNREISLPMINAIKKMASDKIILHLHGLHNYLTYTLCSIFRNLPIIIQHHGDCPPIDHLARRKRLFLFAPILGLEQIAMNWTLPYADYFFVLTRKEQKRLSKLIKPGRVKIQGMGVDFSKFSPINKQEARARLNLPTVGEKILLYVGKLQKYKGFDIVLQVNQELSKRYPIKLLLVGATASSHLRQTPDCFKQTIIFPRQPPELMPFFYSAADVTILPGTKSLADWGGVGVALIESLACGTPVVAGTLKNFVGRIEKVGVEGSTKKEVVAGVEFIFKNPERFSNCRQEAQAFYDWQLIAQATIGIYQKLIKKYYPRFTANRI
jgi:glycosyltransferase involved in cell wall biosynthesis